MSENLLAERQRLQVHLQQLEVFLKSEVHKGWEAARKERLRRVEEDLITFEPVDRKDEIESFKLRGERRLLVDLTEHFEDVRETLNSRLDEIEELLTPNTEKQETNDTE